MVTSLGLWFGANAPWLDTLALFVVCGIALKRKDIIVSVILLDFIVVYFCKNWIKSLELWGSLGLDYHYVLGIKDALIALALFVLAANPWLTFAYVFPSLLCWTLWGSYDLVDYETKFLPMYYAWRPLYASAMLLQIYGLSYGDYDAGKRARRKIIPIDWDRVLQPLYNVAYMRITPINFKTKEYF